MKPLAVALEAKPKQDTGKSSCFDTAIYSVMKVRIWCFAR
jgi:hypothetical protein